MISLASKDLEKAKKYHNKSVGNIIKDIISGKIGYESKKGQKNKSKLTNEQLEYINSNISCIINGKPEELKNLNEKFKVISPENLDKTKDLFKSIYENHFPNNDFLEKLNIDTCTYCNRNYTVQFVKERARAQLDHWFPKDKFPILALSFYNLIPSCQSCNHLKGNGDEIVKDILNNVKATNLEIQKWWEEKSLINLNHPYLKSTDFKFTWFFDGTLNKTKVEFRVKENSNCETTLKFNKTKEIYNPHSDRELKDLLDLRYKYSDNYIDILINKTFKGVMSKEEIYRMIFGIETKEEDYHKRPFSKFKHDIIEELKNIK
jgi:HNH endonuclease